MKNEIEFPVYRKLSNNKRFYKISDFNTFEEIQIIGKKHVKITIEANKYPELLLIMDFINLVHQGIIEISESEWLNVTNS